MTDQLRGRTIAIAIAPRGTEQAEFEKPRQAIEEAGGTVEVVGINSDSAQTVNSDLDAGDTFNVDKTFAGVTAGTYDGLVIPGGSVGSDTLRSNGDAVDFIRAFFEQSKPVAVICHGPWTLVEAGVVPGRTLTSFPSLQTDIRNAGGNWVDKEVVVDNGLVTSRTPDDLPAFCGKLVEEFCEGKH